MRVEKGYDTCNTPRKHILYEIHLSVAPLTWNLAPKALLRSFLPLQLHEIFPLGLTLVPPLFNFHSKRIKN